MSDRQIGDMYLVFAMLQHPSVACSWAITLKLIEAMF